MQTSTLGQTDAMAARALITEEEFAGVVATVLDNNKEMEQPTAERVVLEALKFVDTCVRFPALRLRPSRIVDEGWHALILHTRTYARLCQSRGGFVHHVPERPDPSRHNPKELERTQAAIVEAGYEVDLTLWLSPTDASVPVAADCEHSGGSGGCSGTCFDGGPN
ncbi:glycine-rich domain-containing protein [Streptomyces sp. NPDC002643]